MCVFFLHKNTYRSILHGFKINKTRIRLNPNTLALGDERTLLLSTLKPRLCVLWREIFKTSLKLFPKKK